MRRLLIVSFLIFILALGWRSYASEETGTGNLTLPQPAPNVGESAPHFTAPTLDGETFRVTDQGTYVLTFWSTLNQDSSQAKSKFAELARDYAEEEEEEVSFGAVYVSNIPEGYNGVPYKVLTDSNGRLTSLYNVKRVPRLFVIQDGEIAFVYNTYNETNHELLSEKLEDLVPKDPG